MAFISGNWIKLLWAIATTILILVLAKYHNVHIMFMIKTIINAGILNTYVQIPEGDGCIAGLEAAPCRWKPSTAGGNRPLQVETAHCRWKPSTAGGTRPLQVETVHCRWKPSTEGGNRPLQVETVHCRWKQPTAGGSRSLQVETVHCRWKPSTAGGYRPETAGCRWKPQAVGGNRPLQVNWAAKLKGNLAICLKAAPSNTAALIICILLNTYCE